MPSCPKPPAALGPGLSEHQGGVTEFCPLLRTQLLSVLIWRRATASNNRTLLYSSVSPGCRALGDPRKQKLTSACRSRACTGAPARTASLGTCAPAARGGREPAVSWVRRVWPPDGSSSSLAVGQRPWGPPGCGHLAPANPLPGLVSGWGLPSLSGTNQLCCPEGRGVPPGGTGEESSAGRRRPDHGPSPAARRLWPWLEASGGKGPCTLRPMRQTPPEGQAQDVQSRPQKAWAMQCRTQNPGVGTSRGRGGGSGVGLKPRAAHRRLGEA